MQKDIKVYMSQEEYDAYKNGDLAYGIKADSYYGLIKEMGHEMIGLNVLVKIRPHERRSPIECIFGNPVVDGWYVIRREVKLCN